MVGQFMATIRRQTWSYQVTSKKSKKKSEACRQFPPEKMEKSATQQHAFRISANLGHAIVNCNNMLFVPMYNTSR